MPSKEEGQSTAPLNKWIITITVVTGTLVASINASSVNVALPNMRGNLGATVEEIAWVSAGYTLSCVIIMPLVAWFCSRFGRKRFYMASVLLFITSSILCGMAWDLFSIVAFRIIQGIGGGALIPVAQAILQETFPPRERGFAQGIYGFGVILGPAFGPTIGGWVVDHYSWPWVFYINIPFCIINLFLAAHFIHDPSYLVREKTKVDFSGLVLLIVGLGALQLMLEKGELNNWFDSRFIISLAGVAFVSMVLFIIRELNTDRPAVNLRLLRNLTFASSAALGGVLGLGLFASVFLMPIFLQNLLHYPAIDSGLAMMPRGIAMALFMPLAGRMYNTAGPKALASVGFFIASLSFWQLSRLSLDVGYWDIFVPQVLQGIGMAMVFVPLSTAALSKINKPDMTAAAGLYNFSRLSFGSIGIAISASQLTRGGSYYRALFTESISDYRDATHTWLQLMTESLVHQGIYPSLASEKALGYLDNVVMQQAMMLSYNHVYFLFACLFFVAIPFVFLLRVKRAANNAGIGEVQERERGL
jgi:MFS transporter, DHA2 family, multidrug resistance protein